MDFYDPLWLGWLLVLGICKGDNLQFLKCIRLIAQLYFIKKKKHLWLVGSLGSRKLVNNNSWVAVATSTYL